MVDENIDITDEDEDEESDFSQPVFVTRAGKKEGGKVVKNDTPIENAGDIPLFEDADKRGMKSIAYLRLIKLDKPASGYKGNLPINSTLDTISQLYGDGLYTVEACNHRHQVLRTKENIKISLETVDGRPATTNNNGTAGSLPLEVIREINRRHDIESQKLEKAVMRSADESKENSRSYIELVRTTSEASIQRDRDHMASVNKSQQDFFANMMLAQGQMFQQTMAIMTIGHQNLIESLKVVYDNGKANNKESEVDVLLKGIMVAQSIGGNDDPDWLKALDKGGNMMKTLLMLKGQSPNSDEKDEPEQKKENKKPILSKSELLEIVRLKKVINSRGIDFAEMVRQAREAYIDSGSEEEKSDVNVNDSKNESSEEQTE